MSDDHFYRIVTVQYLNQLDVGLQLSVGERHLRAADIFHSYGNVIQTDAVARKTIGRHELHDTPIAIDHELNRHINPSGLIQSASGGMSRLPIEYAKSRFKIDSGRPVDYNKTRFNPEMVTFGIYMSVYVLQRKCRPCWAKADRSIDDLRMAFV